MNTGKALSLRQRVVFDNRTPAPSGGGASTGDKGARARGVKRERSGMGKRGGGIRVPSRLGRRVAKQVPAGFAGQTGWGGCSALKAGAISWSATVPHGGPRSVVAVMAARRLRFARTRRSGWRLAFALARTRRSASLQGGAGGPRGSLHAIGKDRFRPRRLHWLHGQEGFEVGRDQTA